VVLQRIASFLLSGASSDLVSARAASPDDQCFEEPDRFWHLQCFPATIPPFLG
jgi:hypothetical protein